MKKFITTIPLQTKNKLQSAIYDAQDNIRLQYNEEIAFPIIAVLNGYVNQGEEVIIFALKQNGEGTDENYELFCEQVKKFEQKKKCECHIEVIPVQFDETSGTHLKVFGELIGKLEDCDELYACLTYGTKPIPIIQMMVLNYAYRVNNHTSIGCIVYGQRNWTENRMVIYDITSLFAMDEIVRKIGGCRSAN